MLPALNIPAPVSPPCPSLPLTFPLQLHSNGMRDIISPWGSFNNTFPFTISLPRPLPFPLSILSCLPFPLPILCSLPFLGPFLTALCVSLTIPVVIVIVIPRTAPSTARHTGIRQFLIIIIPVDYLIPIQWSNRHKVAWLALPAAWRLNLCPEIITTVPRATLTGAFNFPWAGCLSIGAIDLISEGTGVVPSSIVHLVLCFVNHLPHIWVEGCQALPKRWTPAPAVRSHHLESWKVASRDWIKKDYIIKRSQGLSFLTPRTLNIHMTPRMGYETNPFIRSRSNDRRRFITNVGIFALAVASPSLLRLPFGANAASWKLIYIWGVTIMIQLNVAEGSPEWMYKVGQVIECALEHKASFCASHVMSR